MIPFHLNSESGLPFPFFAYAVLRNSDSKFLNFSSGNFDSVSGATISDKLPNLAANNLQNLIDGGDNWYRHELTLPLTTGTDPEAFTAFYRNLRTGTTVDEKSLLVLEDELVAESGERPYLGPTDPLSHPLGLLATHIANTSTFRTWCGLPAEDAASTDKIRDGLGFPRRIYWPAYYESLVDVVNLLPKMPICVISPPAAGGLAMSKLTDDDAYEHTGTIDVSIMDRTRAGLDLEKAGRLFMKRLGFLMLELQRIDHANDRLGIEEESVEITHGEPTPAQIATQGVFFEGRFQVGWSG
jgi:hypothetical protein